MTTSIRLVPETEQWFEYLSSHTGRTKAYYLREIIEQGIEDYYLTAEVLGFHAGTAENSVKASGQHGVAGSSSHFIS